MNLVNTIEVVGDLHDVGRSVARRDHELLSAVVGVLVEQDDKTFSCLMEFFVVSSTGPLWR
jgi:metal-dependent HD superfamily phosphatase/phosphodiesterase